MRKFDNSMKISELDFWNPDSQTTRTALQIERKENIYMLIFKENGDLEKLTALTPTGVSVLVDTEGA